MSDLKELFIKRSSIKGRITKFKNYLEALESTDNISSLEINSLNLRLTKFTELFNEFDDLQGRIEILNESNLKTELCERDLIEKDFYYCISKSKEFLDTDSAPSLFKNANSIHSNHHNDDEAALGFRLPVIKIPNFDDVLESIQSNKHETHKPVRRSADSLTRPKTQTRSFVVSAPESAPSKNFECLVCHEKHRIYDCPTFKAKTPEERISQANSLKLCHNCLRRGHDYRQCRLYGTCKFCKKRHNSLLHYSVEPNNGNKNISVSLSAASNIETILSTALIHVTNPQTNHTLTVRALLESGSQTSFITESLKRRLNLTPCSSSVHNIIGIDNMLQHVNTERCAIHISSRNSNFSTKLTCLVLPQITGKLPKCFINVSHLDLSLFDLADPTFNIPSDIDVLIGADLFWDILCSEQQSLGANNPILRSSKLGWILAGPMRFNTLDKGAIHCNFSHTVEIHNDLKLFWELEGLPQKKVNSDSERFCEQHFLNNTRRLNDGRFCVKLPLFDEPTCLGDSYQSAKKSGSGGREKQHQRQFHHFGHSTVQRHMLASHDTQHDTRVCLPRKPNSYRVSARTHSSVRSQIIAQTHQILR
ncbi:unnamed protein product, partial [Brenthis ino]